ncbi:hypothetical protein [Marinilabilia sp.]
MASTPARGSTNQKPSGSSKPAPPKTLKSVSIKAFTKPGSSPARNEAEKNGVAEDSNDNNGIDPSWENAFSPEELQRVWNDYARTVEKTNPRLFSMLTAHSPRLKGSSVVVFPLRNETQEVELMKEKSSLFNKLKRELKNAKLQLEVEYIREERTQQKAFTSADKYKVLAEKNPALNKLKDALNLDLE